ncbi:hypothetical protein [Yersinia frederiksenii]|uniref:hypothetical protein n=1 Tax=Yersinia frederiksenii TaxID=29484 RepID=UPI0005E9D20F|nr:hypothetical protein [Yersinia frederiksenii]CQH42041.1 Uncharacterised protein [Yersinia frederiksenii]
MSENTDYETLKAERDAGLNTCSLIAENAALKERLAEKVKLPDLYWTFDDDKNPVLDADKVIFAIEQAGFAVADNSSDRFIAELANRTPATDAAIAEIKAQGVDELSEWSLKANNGFGIDVTPEEIALFAASLRGEHEIKS